MMLAAPEACEIDLIMVQYYGLMSSMHQCVGLLGTLRDDTIIAFTKRVDVEEIDKVFYPLRIQEDRFLFEDPNTQLSKLSRFIQ